MTLPEILVLSDRTPWMGRHSGYESLPEQLRTGGVRVRETEVVQTWAARALGRFFLTVTGATNHGSPAAAAELKLLAKGICRPLAVKHILFGEQHLAMVPKLRRLPRLMATLHIPPSSWQPQWIAPAAQLDGAIVLYSREMDRFEEWVGRGRVRFVHLGVDTSFFHPVQAHPASPRIVMVGHWLRDVPCALRSARVLAERFAELSFDVVIPSRFRTEWIELESEPRVRWHERLSEEELRALYQGATCMLVPMTDSGANTAVVAALACGLPIVTTDVGGIRDYGGGSLFPLARRGNVDEVVELASRYITDRALRERVGAACRDFAVSTLDWQGVARRHVDVFSSLGV